MMFWKRRWFPKWFNENYIDISSECIDTISLSIYGVLTKKRYSEKECREYSEIEYYKFVIEKNIKGKWSYEYFLLKDASCEGKEIKYKDTNKKKKDGKKSISIDELYDLLYSYKGRLADYMFLNMDTCL